MVQRNVSLSAAIRTNLLSLQTTSGLIDRTQTRLATNLKVASVIDNAVAFFQARSLSNRAQDFDDRKAEIDQAISAVTTAVNGLEAIDTLVKQLKGLTSSAQSATTAERGELTFQFQEIGRQIGKLVNDTSYQGLNLLTSTSARLRVSFSELTHNFLQLTGFDLNSTTTANSRALFTTAVAAYTGLNSSVFNFSTIATANSGFTLIGSTVFSQFNTMLQNLDSSISKVRAVSQSLGSNVALLQTRLDFTKEYVNILNIGAGKLTLADLNEEGANLVSLQTRQQLGIQALAFAGQSEQAILQLFN